MKAKPQDAMWTDAQWEAVCKRDSNILVSAGAGSGKTAVLSERVLEIVREGIHINQLIVLTFTNAAAREMKSRIRQKLALAQDESQLIYDSMLGIDSSFITTFDSYCMYLVKKYHYLLNVDRNLAISDYAGMQQVKERLIKDLINSEVETNPQLAELIINYTAISSESFEQDIIKWHNLSKQNMRGQIITDSQYIFEKYEENVYNQLTQIEAQINRIKVLAGDTNMPEKIDEKLGNLFSIRDFETLRHTLSEITSNKFWMVPRSDFSDKELVKTLNDQVKKQIKNLSANLLHSKETSFQLLDSNNKRYQIIYQLINKFDNLLMSYKLENNLFEFIDINLFAIKLLEENSSIAEQLKFGTYEIMIDEYQDTNDIQERFVSIIANNNVYMVGDIKQAIYGFRNANPKLFASKFNSYLNGDGGHLIVLEENFRSRASVLEQVNNVFAQTMSNDYGGIDYTNNQAMIYGNKSYDLLAETNTNEVFTYVKDEIPVDPSDYEIYQICADIKSKIENQYQVVDGKNSRDCNLSDFAIICSTREKFMRIIEIGEYVGININADIQQRYSSSSEISVVQSFFNIVNCSITGTDKDSKLLYSIMQLARSYMFEYTDDQIHSGISSLKRIKETEVNKILYALTLGELSQLGIIIQDIINDAKLISSQALYQKINLKTTLVSNLYRLDNPLTRQLRLAKLEELLTDLDNRNNDLEDVCLYLNNIERNDELDIEFSVAADSQEAAVTVITIHKSKGLEYNICYFPFLFKKFNSMDLIAKNSYSFDYGLIMPSMLEDMTLSETVVKHVHKSEQMQELISEKIRLLYVALTRAKDKNIIIIEQSTFEKQGKIEDVKTLADILSIASNGLEQYLSEAYPIDEQLADAIKYNKLTKEVNKPEIVRENIEYKDVSIEQHVIINRKASATIDSVIEHKVAKNVAKGNEIHELMEFCDILKIDEEIAKAEGLLETALLNLQNSNLLNGVINYYPEFQFKLETGEQTINGIIDLLVETDESFVIIDYKLNNIHKPEYVEQVKTYKQYLQSISEKNIEGYLLSLISGEVKGV